MLLVPRVNVATYKSLRESSKKLLATGLHGGKHTRPRREALADNRINVRVRSERAYERAQFRHHSSNPHQISAALAFPIPARSFPSLTQLLSLSPFLLSLRKERRKGGGREEKSKREKRGSRRRAGAGGKSEYAAETKIRSRGRSAHTESEREVGEEY